MTSEEQIRCKGAWGKLRNIAKNGLEVDESGDRVAKDTASAALGTLRPLLACAFHQGLHDRDAWAACADPDSRTEIEEQAVQAIIDSLGLGLEA